MSSGGRRRPIWDTYSAKSRSSLKRGASELVIQLHDTRSPAAWRMEPREVGRDVLCSTRKRRPSLSAGGASSSSARSQVKWIRSATKPLAADHCFPPWPTTDRGGKTTLRVPPPYFGKPVVWKEPHQP